MKYIKEVEEFLRDNFAGYKVEVGVNLTSVYIISVDGFNSDHGFSIKLSTFPEDEVAIFGYGEEIMLEMSDENLAKIFEVALKIKRFGTKFASIVNGKRNVFGGYIGDKNITPEDAKQFYRNSRRSMGKWVLPCILECSNFDGSINFSVQVF